MSEITPSDRSQYTEEIKRLREDYQTQEGERARRTQAEKKKMQQNHNAEIERLKQQHEEQLEVMRNKQKQYISDRDQSYQGEIQKLRQIYHDQMRARNDQTTTAQKEVRRTYEEELRKQKEAASQQQEVLTTNFNNERKRQSDEVSQIRDNSQNLMRNTLEEKTQKMNEKLEQDRALIREERDQKIAALSQDKKKMENYLQAEVRRAQQEKRSENERLRVRNESHLHSQGRQFEGLMRSRDQMLQEERRVMLNENQNRRLEHEQVAKETLEALKADIESRYNNHVRGIESDLHRVKSDRVVDMVTQQRIQNLSRRHLVEDYEKRIQEVAQQADKSREIIMDDARQKVNQALSQNDALIQKTNQRARLEKNLIQNQAREDRNGLEETLSQKVDFERDNADKRIGRITKSTQEQAAAEKKYFVNNVEALKDSFTEKLQVQRDLKADELKAIQSRAEKRLKEMEKSYQAKLDQTASFYEAQIGEIKDRHQAEKNYLLKSQDMKIKDMQKNHKDVQESLVTKYENRMSQVYDNNQKELDRVEKRYQEQLATLNARLKYVNRGQS